MLVAVHANRTRSCCSRAGHSAAFAACLRPASLATTGTLELDMRRIAFRARKFFVCCDMNDQSARPHPSRSAAHLPCARPPDLCASFCSVRAPKRKNTPKRAEQHWRRAYVLRALLAHDSLEPAVYNQIKILFSLAHRDPWYLRSNFASAASGFALSSHGT